MKELLDYWFWFGKVTAARIFELSITIESTTLDRITFDYINYRNYIRHSKVETKNDEYSPNRDKNELDFITENYILMKLSAINISDRVMNELGRITLIYSYFHDFQYKLDYIQWNLCPNLEISIVINETDENW